MERQEMERRLAELTQGFFRAKLRLTPRSVEVREGAMRWFSGSRGLSPRLRGR